MSTPKKTTQKDPNVILEVSISYDRKLYFPMEEGIAFINSLSTAKAVKENYNTKPQITDTDSEITFKIVAASILKEKMLEAALDIDKDKDN